MLMRDCPKLNDCRFATADFTHASDEQGQDFERRYGVMVYFDTFLILVFIAKRWNYQTFLWM